MINKIKNYIKDTEFRLTLFKDRVYVANYKKLLNLSDDKISFKVNNGRITILGNNLVLKKLLDKEILVRGNIFSIEAKYE